MNSYGEEGWGRAKGGDGACSVLIDASLVGMWCPFILTSPWPDLLGRAHVRNTSPKCGPGSTPGVTDVREFDGKNWGY